MEANGLPVGTFGAAMRVRRILASAAATVMVAGFGVVAAPGAMAAQNFTAACGESSSRTITVQPNEVITVSRDVDHWCGGITHPAVGTFYTLSNPDPGTVQTFTILGSVTVGATTTVTYYNADISWVLNLEVAATPTPTPATPSSPIPPWVQAYGIFHHDDACETGWTNSWQKWAETVTGGWVCTRTIPSLG